MYTHTHIKKLLELGWGSLKYDQTKKERSTNSKDYFYGTEFYTSKLVSF